MNPKIIHVDSYNIIAHTVFRESEIRIEISKYLKEYPELYNFILEHEKKHANLSSCNLRHIGIDIKDRLKLYYDLKLYNQFKDFCKKVAPKNLKERMFMFLYLLSGEFYMIFILCSSPLVRLIKRLRGQNG